MNSPFPGMDPYLEIHWLWPDVHLALIQEIRVALAKQIAPRYYVAVEERTYINVLTPNKLLGKPDVAIVAEPSLKPKRRIREGVLAYGEPITVHLAARERVIERYLEVRETATSELITAIEILSPANKRPGKGRSEYQDKRDQVLDSLTNFVELDLLRGGEPFDLGDVPESHYRILVRRGWEQQRAQVYAFNVSDLVPEIPIPLRKSEPDPTVKLNDILHGAYDAARYDLRIDYGQPPDPPLEGEWRAWAQARIERAKINP